MSGLNKVLILWLPQGRLGNLIFQYQALVGLKPENSLVLTIQNEFEEVFQARNDFIFIKAPKVIKAFITNALINLSRKLVKLGLLGVITSEKTMHSSGVEVETLGVIRKIGFFSRIQVFDGFFQSAAFSNQALSFKNLRENPSYIDEISMHSGPLIAIHFRFSDYEKWSIFGRHGVVLPENYYQLSIKYMLEKIPSPTFIIFSDNIEAVPKHLFSKHKHVYFRGDHFSSDFKAISLCDHAIISCSTFSWWAAHLINNKNKIVIAPKFWIGFKSSIWHPPDIRNPDYIYFDPNALKEDEIGV